ncbi:MAG TPA: aromatic ring-hydroxylating dioxygenase subunit alpha [Terracidiphilus sp.]|nr:aromatic ring-hydroxylating dioxygenase subunit alpha [Terracidiphilus sp.]
MASDAAVSLVANTSGLHDPLLRREWKAVAWSRDIPYGKLLPIRVMGLDLVLWRSSEGLHCWRDHCVHRGAKLSLGAIRLAIREHAHDCLICPYHAWEYAPSGKCVRIPAHPNQSPPSKARAESFKVAERYGIVWVAFSDKPGPLPTFKIVEDPTYRRILAGPYRMRAQGPRIMENLLDIGHLGVVHTGSLGDPLQGEIRNYGVRPGNTRRGPEAREIRIWQPDPDGTGIPALFTHRYWIIGPLTLGILKTSGERSFGMLAQIAPVDDQFCECRLVLCLNYGHEFSDEELIRFQDQVFEQDRVIVESQQPQSLPLNLEDELHMRSDRMAVAYRKWLSAIGFTYGTSGALLHGLPEAEETSSLTSE